MKQKLTLLGVLMIALTLPTFSQTTTELVKDINPSGDSEVKNFIEVNNKLYFTANDGINRCFHSIYC